MELTPGQRKLAFTVIVLVLAGLGWYLFLPTARGAGNSAGQPGTSRSRARASNPAPASKPTSASSPVPSATGAADTPGGSSAAIGSAPADIYRLLPFTPSALAAAASVVTRFGDDYETFTYSQKAPGYLSPVHGLITRTLAQQLASGYSAPGVANLRVSQKQVSTGTAVITSLRAFGPSSITFIVAITQHLTDSSGRSRNTVDYAVTATGSAGSWQVSSIELASAGNT
jgi:hypothetical protein